MSQPVTIRPSRCADIGRISEIYGASVVREVASFELEPPDDAEMARRRAERLAKNMPYLVAEVAGEVVGFAYAGPFHSRPAYAASVETSVYVDPKAQRKGIGRMLMEEVIALCTERGFRQMIAVIAVAGRPDDSPSIRLHRALGFTDAGHYRAVGYKHGQWVDTWHLQRALGEGDRTPPVSLPGTAADKGR